LEVFQFTNGWTDLLASFSMELQHWQLTQMCQGST
jgi:hypothetical protein